MKRAISDNEKEQRREAIILAALEEFYQNGFKASKMDDIAKRVNVSKGTLYLYFKSKEDVFIAVIESVAKPRISMLQHTLGQAETVFAGLTSLFDMAPYIICQTAMPKLIKVLISDAFVFPEIVKNYRQQVIDQGLNALTTLLKKGQRDKEINLDDAEMTARLIIAPLIFSVIWKVVFEATSDTTLDVHALFAQHKKHSFIALGLTP